MSRKQRLDTHTHRRPHTREEGGSKRNIQTYTSTPLPPQTTHVQAHTHTQTHTHTHMHAQTCTHTHTHNQPMSTSQHTLMYVADPGPVANTVCELG